MLGSSVRGIGPQQRAHAYQACALSVLTYGLALWYAMWGPGVIKLVKKLERVHNYALGWITGSFRTSPIGSREIIAGIPPLKVILNMRLHGTAARLSTLGENHSLSRTWALRWLPMAISNVPPRHRARHLPSDNPLLRLSTSVIREQFMPFHPISRPGNRVADLFSNRIFFELSAPKHSSKFFAAWVRNFNSASILSNCPTARSFSLTAPTGLKQLEQHTLTQPIIMGSGTTTHSGVPQVHPMIPSSPPSKKPFSGLLLTRSTTQFSLLTTKQSSPPFST